MRSAFATIAVGKSTVLQSSQTDSGSVAVRNSDHARFMDSLSVKQPRLRMAVKASMALFSAPLSPLGAERRASNSSRGIVSAEPSSNVRMNGTTSQRRKKPCVESFPRDGLGLIGKHVGDELVPRRTLRRGVECDWQLHRGEKLRRMWSHFTGSDAEQTIPEVHDVLEGSSPQCRRIHADILHEWITRDCSGQCKTLPSHNKDKYEPSSPN